MAMKTNERPGTRAVLRHSRMSSYKAREVLDLIRGVEYTRAAELLEHTERGAAEVIAKLLKSCASNAEHNDGLDPNELYVSTCYADEGATLKRWRPRARGRATRIRKRTCHITIILSRMPEEQIARRRARVAAQAADRRARRVAGTRRRERDGETSSAPVDEAVTNATEVENLAETTAPETTEALGNDAADVEVSESAQEAEASTDDTVEAVDAEPTAEHTDASVEETSSEDAEEENE
jgi:large subunit ribosomal protein L22